MKSPLVIAGLEGSGKTTFITAMLQQLKKKAKNGSAFKPFELALLKRNAAERFSDGELFCQNMLGEPMETLVSPYCAHEDYPLEMSYRRDGIRVNWGVISDRLSILGKLYNIVFVETPDSLFTPITENKMVYEWLAEFNQHVIWLIHPIQSQFQQNLAEIKLMMDLKIPFTILFNNSTQILNQDLLFYIWEKMEIFSNQQAEGMLPHIIKPENRLSNLGSKIEENVPNLFGTIMNCCVETS